MDQELGGIPVKRIFLRSLVVSVAVCAVFGIWAILSGHMGWLEVRVLLTTLTIAVASVCGMACGAGAGTGPARLVSHVGIGLTLLAAALMIGLIWLEPNSEGIWKTTFVIGIYAVACAHLSLVSLARLAPRFLWATVAAWFIILGLATLLSLMIVVGWDNEIMFRQIGVGAILDAAISLLIPIFHKMSKPDLATADAEAAEALEAQLTSQPPLPAEPDMTREQIDLEIARLRERIEELERMKGEGE